MRTAFQRIIQSISGERAFYSVREIANFHRIQASTGYRAAAYHVKQRLEENGLDVSIKTYPADGKTWYYTSKMFQEWDCRDAQLNLVSPAECLADFRANNLSIIQRSYPCDFRSQPLDIVLLDQGSAPKAYEGLDLKGKLVFVREHFQAFVDWAVKERGALGFVTDFIRPVKGARERHDLVDILNYTSFWWKHTPDEPHTFGFVLTPRQGDQLARLCKEAAAAHAKDPSQDAYPKATCYVDADLYDGEIEVVETLLKGQTEEEVLIVSHLCHPRSSANDNASGVAASMEALKVIRDLVASGALPGLKRSIRMIFVPEFTGTYPYLHELGERTRRIKAGINLDMVGGRQSHGYGPVNLSGLPHASPSFIVDLAALIMDEVRKNVPSAGKDSYLPMFNAVISEFEPGSDHLVLSDPTINIPAVMLGQWPDLNYHTSGDTAEVVDPFILHKTASICACFAYTLAALAVEDIPLILYKSRERFVAELSKQIALAVETGGDPADLHECIRHYRDFYLACNRACMGFFQGQELAQVQEAVSKENRLLEEMRSAMWRRYQEDFAPGFVPAPASIPEIYRYVPVRKFTGPIVHLEDYALGDAVKMEACKVHVQQHQSKLHSGYMFDAVVGFYMDGKRSLWEIAKETMLETRDGSLEYVHAYVQLLRSFGLVEIHEA